VIVIEIESHQFSGSMVFEDFGGSCCTSIVKVEFRKIQDDQSFLLSVNQVKSKELGDLLPVTIWKIDSVRKGLKSSHELPLKPQRFHKIKPASDLRFQPEPACKGVYSKSSGPRSP
jgi:hypothetical protein